MSLSPEATHNAIARLVAADEVDSLVVRARPPVLHVVYGGAHLFKHDTLEKVAVLARRSFETYAPDSETFAAAIGLDPALASTTYECVHARLAERAVEDYRIDFEDGYGQRADAEEDAHAESAAKALASVPRDSSTLLGIRIKSLGAETRHRAIRTLDRFFGTYAASAKAPLPVGFVVTLPKVRVATEVAVLVELLSEVERGYGLGANAIGVELMIETPEAVIAHDGTCPLRELVRAAGGRCASLHLGSYDLMSSVGVLPPDQRLTHPICDLAKYTMQIALAGTGIALSDGATTTLPIERFRAASLSEQQKEERAANREAIHRAWGLHAANVRHGLRSGFLCGWDLHPAQIPARLGAVFGFFREILPAMKERLQAHRAGAEQASRVGQTFDDRATAEGLRAFFRVGAARGLFQEPDV